LLVETVRRHSAGEIDTRLGHPWKMGFETFAGPSSSSKWAAGAVDNFGGVIKAR
jgi:hypothetical protein